MSDEVKDPTEKREELLLAMPDVGEMVLNATYVVPLVNLNRKAVRFAVVSTWGINLDSPDPIEPKILESFESEDLATLYKGATDRMDALKMEINRLRAKAGEPSIDAHVPSGKREYGSGSDLSDVPQAVPGDLPSVRGPRDALREAEAAPAEGETHDGVVARGRQARHQ